MKKIISVFLAMTLVFSLVSCKKDVKPAPEQKKPVKEEEITGFYGEFENSKSRPVAVMIDNDSDVSRPQTGVENAFLVYEMMVEGASTRMMALFMDSELSKVGPVRSSRHYFLDYVLENDAIYAHCGYSPQAQRDLVSLGINNLNEITTNNGKNYFRDNSRLAPHNLYTNLPELLKFADTLGYRRETDKDRVFSYNKTDGDIGGDVAEKIILPYSNHYTVSYEYNAEKGVYDRYINGEKHMSASSEDVLTAENILVYKVTNYSIDDVGRQNLENIGSGRGYYISNGECVKIDWSKTSRGEKTVYMTKDGPLKLNPGNTFVQIIPQEAEITIE